MTTHQVKIVNGLAESLCGTSRSGDKCVDGQPECAQCQDLLVGSRFPQAVSPMPEGASNYDILVKNLVPRIIRTLGVATADGMFTMTELIEVYERILNSEPQFGVPKEYLDDVLEKLTWFRESSMHAPAGTDDLIKLTKHHLGMEVNLKWNVWTRAKGERKWLCVVEGVSKKEATEAAERQQEAAIKYSVDASYIALPDGSTPV